MTHLYIKPYLLEVAPFVCVRVNVYACKYYVYTWYMVHG